MRAKLGILEMVGLAGTLVFALPLGIFGLDRLLAGDALIGGVALAIAVAMIVVPRVVTTPDDAVGKVAEKTVGNAVKEPDEDR